MRHHRFQWRSHISIDNQLCSICKYYSIKCDLISFSNIPSFHVGANIFVILMIPPRKLFTSLTRAGFAHVDRRYQHLDSITCRQAVFYHRIMKTLPKIQQYFTHNSIFQSSLLRSWRIPLVLPYRLSSTYRLNSNLFSSRISQQNIATFYHACIRKK